MIPSDESRTIGDLGRVEQHVEGRGEVVEAVGHLCARAVGRLPRRGLGDLGEGQLGLGQGQALLGDPQAVEQGLTIELVVGHHVAASLSPPVVVLALPRRLRRATPARGGRWPTPGSHWNRTYGSGRPAWIAQMR